MSKQDLEEVNAELIDLLGSIRDRIEDTLDELAAVSVDDEDEDEDEAEDLDDEEAD